MANPEHVEIVKRGAEAIRTWRNANPKVRLDLCHAGLSQFNLSGADLSRADLSNCRFHEADLREADLREANLQGADLSNVTATCAFMHGANLGRAYLCGANLASANLIEASIMDAKICDANLTAADLSRANLSRSNLARTRLCEAELGDANVAIVKLCAAQLDNAKCVRTNLCGANLEEASLIETDLTGAQLAQSNLKRVRMSRTNLEGADLSAADMAWANLEGANLHRTKLHAAKLHRSNLSNAGLFSADLTLCNLSATGLAGANLDGAFIFDTTFTNVDLSRVRGLARIFHHGPSYIDFHTLMKSRGQIPEVFLRGCGLSDEFIDYIPSLFGDSAIEFYSCFISYNHGDAAFARRLHDALQGRGIRCWLDEHQIKPGDDIYSAVDKGIRVWDKVLLCCSKSAFASGWVDREVDTAIEEEMRLHKERGEQILKIIPLNLDGSLFDWKGSHAAALRKRLAPDFTNWKRNHDKFEAQFERVVEALRADSGGKMPDPAGKL